MVLNKQEKGRLPGTLKRSSAKAQATYRHTFEAAQQVHGIGAVAHRIALGSLKHFFERIGGQWEPKDDRGPDDVDNAQSSRVSPWGRSRPLVVWMPAPGKPIWSMLQAASRSFDRWPMGEADLVAAIDKADRAATAKATRRATTRT